MTTRALRFDPKDGRPESAFGLHWLTGAAIAGGFLLELAVVALVVLAMLLGWVVDRIQDALTDEQQPAIMEEDVIEARFIQLGREFQDELPNREVPIVATAPPRPSEVPTEDTPDTPPPQVMEERPPEAVESDIAQLIARAGVHAEMAQPMELEGSPDGVEGGSRDTGEGDAYAGRLATFFRRGWTVPTTLAADEVRGLTTVASVTVGPELQIVSFEIRTSSGDPLFDASVTEQLERLRAADSRIPPPPEDQQDRYIDSTFPVRFRGRDAR